MPADTPLLTAKASTLAEQLSLFDSQLFALCSPIEYLNVIWNRNDDGHDAPNLSFFSERFNRETAWVAAEIVETADLGKRIKILSKFIEVAKVRFNFTFPSVFSFPR